MPLSGTIRLAVFDCDGTLVDSQHAIIASMFQSFDANGFARPDANDVRHVVGLPLGEAIGRLLPAGGADDHARLEAAYVAAFRGMRERGEVIDTLYPGAIEVLDMLDADGWILGVATGKSSRGLLATLDSHGIRHRFVTLQTADRGPGKPNPDMLLNAMKETGADPATTVMIGDTTYDMEMARRAGALAVGVAWGYHPEEHLRRAGAHAVIRAFDELMERLEALASAPRGESS